MTARLFKGIGLAAAGVLLLSALIVAAALTPMGLKICVAAAERFLPELSVESAEGTLARARLAGIVYRSDTLSADVGELTLSIGDLQPLARRITLDKLHVKGLRLDIKPAADEAAAESTPVSTIELPVSITLASLKLEETDVHSEAADISISRLALSGRIQGDLAFVRELSVDGVRVNVPESNAEQPHAPALPERLRALLSKPLLKPVEMPAVPIRLQAPSVMVRDVRVNEAVVLESASASFAVEHDRIELAALELTQALATVNAQGTVALAGALKARLQTDLRPHLSAFAPYRLHADLTADTNSGLALEVNAASEQSDLTVRADVKAVQTAPTLKLSAQGSLDLSPLQDLLGFAGSLHEVDLQAEGSYETYSLSMKSRLLSALLPEPIAVSVQAQGHELSLEQARLRADLGDTSVSANLRAFVDTTQAGVSGTLEAAWNELRDVARLLRRELPESRGTAQLVFDARVDAQFSPNSLQARIDKLETRASVNGVDLSAQACGHVRRTDEIVLDTLEVKAADAQLHAQGTLKKEAVSGTFSIRAKDLSKLEKSLAGSIQGQGTVQGTLSLPQLQAELHASSIRSESFSVKQADISAHIRAENRKGGLVPKAEIRVSAASVESGEQFFKTVTAELSGTPEAHTLTLASEGRPVALDVRLKGRLSPDNTVWSGALVSAELKTQLGSWSAQGTPALSARLDKPAVTVSAHCWASGTQRLEVCLREDMRAADSGEIKLEMKNAELTLLKDFLPADVALQGSADAQARLSWTQPDVRHARAEVSVTGRDVAVSAETSGVKQTLALDRTNIAAVLTPQKAQLRSSLSLDNGAGSLRAEVTVAEPLEKRELSGRVTVQGVKLEQFSPVLGAVAAQTTAAGELSADITAGGSLEKPALYGSAQLTEFTAQGQAVPLDMKPSNVTLQFRGDHSALLADLQTEQGALTVRGRADWSDPKDPKASVRVKGDKVRVSLPPYVTARVSPDIEARIRLQNLKLSGSITISQAHISVKDLPSSAVSASDDEEIIRPNQVAVRVKTPMQIESSLVIHLAENVNLTAFGLKSQLQGDVTVKQRDQTLGLNGTIRLVNGTFKAYGQDLVINKGNLTFAGPVTKPILDFEAIRNPETIEDDVTAGIRIRGPSDAPQTELFTDPAMSQANAISYIMRGQGLDSSGDADSSVLTTALLGMGLSQTGQIVSSLGEMLRISDLTLSTDGSGNDSKLVVSGYVLPGLQVKYAMGIFNSIATLTLRYRLLARLFVEASSGTAQSLDLLYTFEF